MADDWGSDEGDWGYDEEGDEVEEGMVKYHVTCAQDFHTADDGDFTVKKEYMETHREMKRKMCELTQVPEKFMRFEASKGRPYNSQQAHKRKSIWLNMHDTLMESDKMINVIVHVDDSDYNVKVSHKTSVGDLKEELGEKYLKKFADVKLISQVTWGTLKMSEDDKPLDYYGMIEDYVELDAVYDEDEVEYEEEDEDKEEEDGHTDDEDYDDVKATKINNEN